MNEKSTISNLIFSNYSQFSMQRMNREIIRSQVFGSVLSAFINQGLQTIITSHQAHPQSKEKEHLDRQLNMKCAVAPIMPNDGLSDC